MSAPPIMTITSRVPFTARSVHAVSLLIDRHVMAADDLVTLLAR